MTPRRRKFPAVLTGAAAERAERDWVALKQWAKLGPKCQALVERILAAQGEAAEREFITLQHQLAAANRITVADDQDIPL